MCENKGLSFTFGGPGIQYIPIYFSHGFFQFFRPEDSSNIQKDGQETGSLLDPTVGPSQGRKTSSKQETIKVSQGNPSFACFCMVFCHSNFLKDMDIRLMEEITS